ncbi:MAG TPA: hypothetical protein VK568_17315 [Thermodesulfobacteriota bacterium]|nr:hypothetical protein [Thermodesulfobacteriota bacterium]
MEHGGAHAFFAVTLTNLFSGKTGLVAVSAAIIFHSPSPSSSITGTRIRLSHARLFTLEFLPVKALNCQNLLWLGHKKARKEVV